MNTTQLKSFAAEARKSLLSGVKSKMNALGFRDNGTVDERDYPMQAPDGTLFQGEIYDVSFYGKWMRLKDEIAHYGFRQVCEEGAYTWFNRLMAIQILSRNGLIDPVLEFESPDVRIPLMVKQAHEGIRPEMTAFDATRLNAVIDDDNRITDQFAILIVAYCQSTPILYKCFGTLNDFTELLLPTNILASNGFLNLLNGSTFITQDDYKTTELIGWLYQFYISERKDEVFASFKKGQKANANDIPAATQIFTPNWIVKYMVQNTLARIYLDNNPDSTLKDSWQYLVDSPSERGQGGVLQLSSLENYTFADLSCGSGHILGEAFDLLYAIYIEEGYTRRQAIKAIFQRNLLGIDIDTRAKQLATFTLMLKASKQWADAINCEVMPRVLDMPLCDRYTWLDLEGHMVTALQIKSGTQKIAKELEECFHLLEQARNLGSIMKFNVTPETRAFMQECFAQQAIQQKYVENFKPLFEGFELILALTEQYASVVMNPPYMGSGNMNAELAKYVKDNYEDEKSDLFAVFMKVAEDRLLPNAKYGMINMQSWMFLPSFEKMRTHIINELQIDSMIHLGPRTFDELSGEVVQNTAYVVTNQKPSSPSSYFRLVSYAPSGQKEAKFLDALKDDNPTSKNFKFSTNQSNFKNIVGCPIGYWLSARVMKILIESRRIGEVFEAKQGLATGDNDRFLRLWHEIDFNKIGIGLSSIEDAVASLYRWFPYKKGGASRKWYGNQDYVVDWNNDGYEIKNNYDESGKLRSRPQNLTYYFKESISWSLTSTSGVSAFRYFPKGFIFDVNGMSLFAENTNKLLAFLNTKFITSIIQLINPTMACQIGDVNKLPICYLTEKAEVIASNCINISKQDWDAHETSWDFQENELARVFKEGKAKDLQAAVSAYKEEWEKKFDQLHDNEIELNRQFIEIYGLQEELTPEVPYDEVTILQQGEITIE